MAIVKTSFREMRQLGEGQQKFFHVGTRLRHFLRAIPVTLPRDQKKRATAMAADKVRDPGGLCYRVALYAHNSS